MDFFTLHVQLDFTIGVNILNQSFKVYGERGKLFSVDNLCVCYGNFIRRCKKEGIEVRVNGEKVEEEEKS